MSYQFEEQEEKEQTEKILRDMGFTPSESPDWAMQLAVQLVDYGWRKK